MKQQIIFVPGLTYDGKLFKAQIKDLEDIATCKVVINKLSARDQIADNIVGAFSRGKISIVTHSSVGCLPGYAAAIKYPDRVENLVLLGACADFGEDLVTFIRGVKRQIQKGELKEVRNNIAKAALGSGHPNQQKLEEQVAKTQTLEAHTVIEQCDYLIKYAKISQELKHIRARTLIIQAENDGFFKPSVSEEIKKLIPNSRRTIIPGIGHMIPLENEGATTALIRLHLS